MDRQDLARGALLGAIYFAAAGIAVAFTRYGGVVANLWIASGILIASLSAATKDRWPVKLAFCFVGSALATGLWGMGWWLAFPMAAVKMAEAAVGAALFQRFDGRRKPSFDSFTWFFRFVAIVGLVAPLVSATGLAALATLAGKDFWAMATGVFIANSLGNLATVPLALPIASKLERAETLVNVARGGFRFPVAIAVVIATSLAVFLQSGLPLLFLPVMPLLLATFILGREAAALGVIALAAIGGILTIAGHGPMMLIEGSPGERLLVLQFYVAMTVLTLLPVAADLHAKRRMLRELGASEERFRLMAEQSSDIITRIDPDGRMSYVSPAIERLCGYRPDELLDTPAIALVSDPYKAQVAATVRAIFTDPDCVHGVEWLGLLKDGRLRWFETNGSAVRDPSGRVVGSLHVIRDIDDRKRMEEELSRAALTDPLTGLPNRRAFRDVVEGRLGSEGGGAGDCIAMFDVDLFKQVNDRFGHDVGDAVLRHLANIASVALREGDVVARLGGEEFGLFLPDTPVQLALLVCERFRQSVALAPLVIGDREIAVTISGGFTSLAGRDLDEALRAADIALYEAKAGGRDQVMLAA